MTTTGMRICRALVEYRNAYDVSHEQLAARMGLPWKVFKTELESLHHEFQVTTSNGIVKKWIKQFGDTDKKTMEPLWRQRC